MRYRLLLAAAALGASACAAGTRGAGPAAPRARIITMNGQGSGTLRESDARLSDNSVYQAWSFWGTAGQTVQIDVLSNDFDAFAILQDGQGVELVRDDDSGDGTDARIVFTIPADGQYRILANSYRAGRYGAYTVRLRTVAAVPPGAGAGVAGSVARGQSVTGTLRSSDQRLSDGSVYQAWLYNGRAGETITIEVRSRDFDAYAILQDGSGNRLASDDDSGDGTNALLAFTLPYTGVYRIIANAYRQRSFGSYTLDVR